MAVCGASSLTFSDAASRSHREGGASGDDNKDNLWLSQLNATAIFIS